MGPLHRRYPQRHGRHRQRAKARFARLDDSIEKLKESLSAAPATWLVTGAAGFIGSHLAGSPPASAADGHRFGQPLHRAASRIWPRSAPPSGRPCGSISLDPRRHSRLGPMPPGHARCRLCLAPGRARLGSALTGGPRRNQRQQRQRLSQSLAGPPSQCGVKRFVFASSSSVYGDETALPQREKKIGRCLSPYAVSKRVNELYADVFASCYGLETIGLRYFNVFGPRQDPNGAYAAVIPKWIAALIQDQPVAHQRRRLHQPRFLLCRQCRPGQPPGGDDAKSRGGEPDHSTSPSARKPP